MAGHVEIFDAHMEKYAKLNMHPRAMIACIEWGYPYLDLYSFQDPDCISEDG
jgi:hypothetical protein